MSKVQYPALTTEHMALRYDGAPQWWVNCRTPWKKSWWRENEVPQDDDYASEGENYDLCFNRIGKRPITLGRNLLIQLPILASGGAWEIGAAVNAELERTTDIGLVLQVGLHAYPETSDTYGTLPFVYPGDWVEYSHWEKAKAQYDGCIYVKDLHITSIINPLDYHTVLRDFA